MTIHAHPRYLLTQECEQQHYAARLPCNNPAPALPRTSSHSRVQGAATPPVIIHQAYTFFPVTGPHRYEELTKKTLQICRDSLKNAVTLPGRQIRGLQARVTDLTAGFLKKNPDLWFFHTPEGAKGSDDAQGQDYQERPRGRLGCFRGRLRGVR